MTLKPIIIAAGTSLTLFFSNAWAADVKEMAADAAKDSTGKMAQEQATDAVKEKTGTMMPATGAVSAMKVAPSGATEAVEGAAGAAALQKAAGGATGDVTGMAKDQAMEMGKDQATEAAKKMVK